MQCLFEEGRSAGCAILQIAWRLQYDEQPCRKNNCKKEWYVPVPATMRRDLHISCKKLNVKGVVFMPVITPNQKVNQTKMFGDEQCRNKTGG